MANYWTFMEDSEDPRSPYYNGDYNYYECGRCHKVIDGDAYAELKNTSEEDIQLCYTHLIISFPFFSTQLVLFCF